MKITIQRNELINRLSQVSKAINTKPAVPILEGVLIQADGRLTLTCSDSNFTITTTTDAYTEHEPGAAVIPAKKLLDIINKMPQREIDITADNAVAEVRCEKTKVRLSAMDAEQFPTIKWPAIEFVSLDGAALIDLLNNTKHATASNEAMPILQGILIEQKEEMVTATTTDRYRLARKSVVNVHGVGEVIRTVTPLKLLDAAVRLKPEKVGLGIVGNQIYLVAEDYRFIASTYDGNYPEVERIIPNTESFKVYVDKDQLLKTLELAESVADGKTKIVRLDVARNEMRVTAKDADSSMEEVLEVESGGEINIAANARYLIDALKCIDTDRVEIRFIDNKSPMILTGENDDSGLHLVLPYRMTE